MQNTSLQKSQYLKNIYHSCLNYININQINALDGSRGKTVLESEYDVLCYVSAYFAHHIAKAFCIFEKFDFSCLEGKRLSLVDWASGPATASLAFLEYCRLINTMPDIRHVTLVDAGTAALSIGDMYLNDYMDAKILFKGSERPEIIMNQSFLQESDFPKIYEDEITIHFLSNMLDLGGIDKSVLAKNISVCSTGAQYVFCMGPSYFAHQYGLMNFNTELNRNANVELQTSIDTTTNANCYMFRNNCFKTQSVYVNGKIFAIRRD